MLAEFVNTVNYGLPSGNGEGRTSKIFDILLKLTLFMFREQPDALKAGHVFVYGNLIHSFCVF